MPKPPSPTMRYPDRTPTGFAGAKQFVERYGFDVWTELCDEVRPDQWFRVSDVAGRLPTLRRYKQPARYLRAVLKAVIADFEERPDAYEGKPPVTVRGTHLVEASV